LGSTGADGAVLLTPTATLDGRTIPVQSAVSSGAGDGLYQVTVVIPPDTTGAPALTISQGDATSNAVTLTIQ
jgi:uncharacterized protein (TIGR03437 family)